MVETIGEAFGLGWQLKARCAAGNREGLKSIRRCVWTYDLDMLTLVATRGRDFPLAMLASRLRCPRCGSRQVSVVFMPPADGIEDAGRLEGTTGPALQPALDCACNLKQKDCADSPTATTT